MNRTPAVITLLALTALVLAVASASAGDRPRIGAAAPLPVMRDLAGHDRPLAQLAGRRGLVILFWAAWSDRSLEELRRLNAAAQTLAAHGVTVAAVSVEHYQLDAENAQRLQRLVRQLDVTVPVLIDHGLALFNAYGVVTVPSTAVVDGKGRLSYFLYGYSIEQREELFDAINSLAGITRDPPAAATRTVASAALRRLQLGRFQLARGEEDAARSSFDQASTADETFPDPIVELAALALDHHDLAAARTLLDRAAALDAGHIGLRRERARFALLERRAADARTALEELSSNGGDSATLAYLGYLLHSAGDRRRAESAFDRAKALSGSDPRRYITPVASDVAGAAMAMTAYRREVAPARR